MACRCGAPDAVSLVIEDGETGRSVSVLVLPSEDQVFAQWSDSPEEAVMVMPGLLEAARNEFHIETVWGVICTVKSPD